MGPTRIGVPIRPGFAVIVADDGPPELVNLLDTSCPDS